MPACTSVRSSARSSPATRESSATTPPGPPSSSAGSASAPRSSPLFSTPPAGRSPSLRRRRLPTWNLICTPVSALSPAEPNKLARVYLDHALAGRGGEAAQILIEALVSESIGLVDLFESVLAPAAQRVGDLWYAAQIS